MKETSLGHGAFYITIASFVFVISGYLINIILGRSLGPASYGIYGIIITLMTTVNLTQTSGLPQAVAKYVAEDEENADSVLKSGLVLQGLSTMTVSAILLLFAVPIAQLLKDISLEPYIQISAFVFPFYGIYSIYLSYYNGLHYFKTQAIMSMLYAILKLFFVLSFVYLFHIYGAIIGFIVSPVIALLFWVHIPKNFIRTVPYKKLIFFSIPLIALAIFGTLLQSLDLFFVKALLKANKYAGFYTAVQNIAEIPFYAVPALASVLFPSISRNFKQNLHQNTKNLISKSLRICIIIITPSVLLISATSQQLLSFIYSPSYLPGAGALAILVIGNGFFTFYTLLSTIMSGSGSPLRMAVLTGGGVLMSIIFCILLIPPFGVNGAAFATTIAMFSIMIVSSLMVYRKFNILFPIKSALKVLISSLLIFVLAKLINFSLVLLPIFFLILAVVYIVSLILMKELTKKDIAMVKSLLPLWIVKKVKI